MSQPQNDRSGSETTDSPWRQRHRKPLVTVFGAGVTGLSAAHELIERGFRVQVVEPTPDPRSEYGVRVGGIAANQYGAVPAELERLHPYLFPEESFDYLVANGLPVGDEPSPAVATATIDDPIAQRLLSAHRSTYRSALGPAFSRLLAERTAPVVEALRVLRDAPLTRTRRPLWLPGRLGYAARSEAGFAAPDHDALRQWTDARGRSNEERIDSAADTLVKALNARLRAMRRALELARRDVPEEVLDAIPVEVLRREVLAIEVIGHAHPHCPSAQSDTVGLDAARSVRELLVEKLHDRRGAIGRWLLESVFGRALENAARLRQERMPSVEDWFWGAPPSREGAGATGGIGDCFVCRAASAATEDFPSPPRRGRPEPARVELRAVERLLPGEHGYRFFPSFYRHTFDLMRRTPVLDALDRETGRTCLDALLTPPDVSVALAGERTIEPVPRRRLRSLEELRRVLEVMLEKIGYTPKDMHRYFLQMFRFMTACDARRRSWESLSWLEFVSGREEHVAGSIRGQTGYSSIGERMIVETPRALLAMGAEETDAYSHGVSAVQMLLDYQADGGSVDRTLDGPTDEVWLDPWKRYLVREGVRFYLGRLGALCPTPGAPDRLVPEIDWIDQPCAAVRQSDGPEADAAPPLILDEASVDPFDHDADFFLLALPYAQAAAIVHRAASDRQRPALLDGDLARLDRFHRLHVAPGLDEEEWRAGHFLPERGTTGRPRLRTLPLRDLSGLQLFFEKQVRLGAGHLVLPDSSFGLSSISQLALWRDRTSDRRGFLGQISVDLGDFYRRHVLEEAERAFGWTRMDDAVRRILEQQDSRRRHLEQRHAARVAKARRAGRPADADGDDAWRRKLGKPAWQCTPEELAIRVWDQILDTRPREYGSRVSPPDFFHVDESLVFRRGARGGIDRNESLFFINVPGQWPDRPGIGDEPGAIAYRVSNRRFVLAGSFVATHTRIMTMEACIESGRHAVNTILHALLADTWCERYRGGGRFLGDACAIHDPARFEVPDFEPLKRLDERLVEAGVPHFVDVLGIREWIERMPDPDPDDRPLHDLATLGGSALANYVADWGFAGPTADDWIRSARQSGSDLARAGLRSILEDEQSTKWVEHLAEIVGLAMRERRDETR